MANSSDEIFVMTEHDVKTLPLRTMREGFFGRTLEDSLQHLLEKHPNVLSGAQIDPSSDDPPRFMLLRREMPISGMSLDHLLVDQHGVLTLVEAKLVENPESRRDVIGQIIEYAANASGNWGHGRIQQLASDYYAERGLSLDDILTETFGDELEVDDFWSEVESKLEQGKLRIVIASDAIKPEVRKMIEFLNHEMQSIEVLGLEIKCFGTDDSSVVLVPRIIGQTTYSVERRSHTADRITWSPDLIRERMEAEDKTNGRLVELMDWCIAHNCFREARAKNLGFYIENHEGSYPFSVWSEGQIYCGLSPFYFDDDRTKSEGFFNKIKDAGLLPESLDLSDVKDGRNLSYRLGDMTPTSYQAFLEIVQEYCSR